MRAPSAGCRFMRARSSSLNLPGLVRTSIGMRTFPMSCSRPAIPKPRTSRAPSPRYSASPMASTATFIECVVVYWSNSFNCSSGITIWRPPRMASASERTTASASVSGSTPRVFTSSWNQRTVSASSPRE